MGKDNVYGQSGIGKQHFNKTANQSSHPIVYHEIKWPSHVKYNDVFPLQSICCGWKHSCLIDRYNHLWLFGWNNSGQCGSVENHQEQNEGINLRGMASTYTTISQVLPSKVSFPTEYGTISQIAAGATYTLIQTLDGMVYIIGGTDIGITNDDEEKTKKQEVSLSALSKSMTARARQISSGLYHFAALDAENNKHVHIVSLENGIEEVMKVVFDIGIRKLYCSYFETFAVTIDGGVYVIDHQHEHPEEDEHYLVVRKQMKAIFSARNPKVSQIAVLQGIHILDMSASYQHAALLTSNKEIVELFWGDSRWKSLYECNLEQCIRVERNVFAPHMFTKSDNAKLSCSSNHTLCVLSKFKQHNKRPNLETTPTPSEPDINLLLERHYPNASKIQEDLNWILSDVHPRTTEANHNLEMLTIYSGDSHHMALAQYTEIPHDQN